MGAAPKENAGAALFLAADSPDSSSFVLFIPRVAAVGLAPKSEGAAEEDAAAPEPKVNKLGAGLPLFEASDEAAEKLNAGLGGASSSGFFGVDSAVLAAAPNVNRAGAGDDDDAVVVAVDAAAAPKVNKAAAGLEVSAAAVVVATAAAAPN